MPKVTEAHLEKRRGQILDAAIACFSRRGFRETTMADIAAEAGVSDGLAYRYFSNKEEIIDAAIREEKDPIRNIAEQVDDFPTMLRLLLSTNARRVDRTREFRETMDLQFRAWGEALSNESVRNDVLDRWKRHLGTLEGLISRAQEQGSIPTRYEAQALARVMLATHYGLNLQAALDPDIEIGACIETLLELVATGLTADGDRA